MESASATAARLAAAVQQQASSQAEPANGGFAPEHQALETASQAMPRFAAASCADSFQTTSSHFGREMRPELAQSRQVQLASRDEREGLRNCRHTRAPVNLRPAAASLKPSAWTQYANADE
jgi:hypothetical protein